MKHAIRALHEAPGHFICRRPIRVEIPKGGTKYSIRLRIPGRLTRDEVFETMLQFGDIKAVSWMGQGTYCVEYVVFANRSFTQVHFMLVFHCLQRCGEYVCSSQGISLRILLTFYQKLYGRFVVLPMRNLDVPSPESMRLDEIRQAQRSIYVSSISSNYDVVSLRELLSTVGRVVHLDVKYNQGNKGIFAFCQYDDNRAPDAAIQTLVSWLSFHVYYEIFYCKFFLL